MTEDKLKKHVLEMMVTALALLVGDWWIDGVSFSAPWIAIVTALVLALLNTFVKPLIVFLTIPATLFSFGLFLLVINAMIILLAKEIIPNNQFRVDGFWPALWLSLIISIANALFGARVKVVRNNPEDFD